MKIWHWRFALVLAVLVWAVAPTAASAKKHAHTTKEGANTFSGQCALSGVVSFSPALTVSPQSISQEADASGTCSGRFTDRKGRTHQLTGAPVSFSESSEAPNASCGFGTSNGRAILRFDYGSISSAFHEVRAGGAATITLTGDRGGMATALVNVSTSENPVSILSRCAGAGLSSVGIDAHAITVPSISG